MPPEYPAHLAVARVGQADTIQQLDRACGSVLLRQPVQPALKLEVLAPGEEVVQRRLLQSGADPPAHLRPLRRHVEARDGRASRGRREQRGEDVDRRGLARAIGAEEPVDLAGLDLELDAVDRPDAAFELADEPVHSDAVVGHGGVR